MLSCIQKHWPAGDEYDEREAERLADLLDSWKWRIDECNLSVWVRSHMRRAAVAQPDDWEVEVTEDATPAKTCFQCGSGGGRRVIRKGMEMS